MTGEDSATGPSRPGRVALVTGAARGVGKGIAIELARAGYRVALNDHPGSAELDSTVSALRAEGADVLAVRGDVSQTADVRTMVARVVDHFGALEILVNNAGIQVWTPLLEVTDDDWDRVIATNLRGCFLCTREAATYMKDHGGGSIINIGSASNKLPFANLSAYTASKGAIEMFTRVAAVELGVFGIRVNCVAPGAIEVERTRHENPAYATLWSDITPLGRIGTPEDVGRAVVYFAGSDAGFVSGQTLWVDGALFTQAMWPYRRER